MTEKDQNQGYIDVDFEMAFNVQEDYVQCQLSSISEEGVVARITGGYLERLRVGARGNCLFDYLDESFEGECTVVDIRDTVITLHFCSLDEDQLFFVRSLMEEVRGAG